MKAYNGEGVAVIMSTYNGFENVSAQLDSILSQTYNNIHIYIRDDGSKDNTPDILDDYEKKYDNITIIKDELGNLGVPKSFYHILNVIPKSKYYAFSDQDDIWYENKIERAVEYLDKLDDSKPNLYLASFDYYKADGEYIRSFPDQTNNLRFNMCLFNTLASGFVIVINDEGRKKFVPKVLNDYELHDRWMIRAAMVTGNVVYDPCKVAKHIRHDLAVTKGDSTNTSLLITWFNEINSGENLMFKHWFGDFYRQYKSDMNVAQKRMMKLFMSPDSLRVRFSKAFYPLRLRSRILGELALRLQFILGKA